ncbi:UvrD-helicase domain-containing protein [Variovorax ureilyticus]|uniref:UvrD-helicase domain-containing protein n=1 Tax=Variovorax ureilyticus TaxID=1836198 RepID=UPI003D676A6B
MTSTAPPYLKAAEDLRGNEDQWRAYQSTGNCVILAGPGSGKTKTITVKIACMLTEDVHRPRRLACITYSNACVGELRSRLNKLGADDGDRLLLSTVHSFCLTELVSPYAALAGIDVPDPLIVASPAQARKLFADAYRGQLGGNVPNWFRMACDKLRRTIPDKDSDEWRAWSARETAVVEAYEALLLKNGLIDFDGLVLAGLQLVEKHEWVRRAIQAKYPVVVIDEYQDLGLPCIELFWHCFGRELGSLLLGIRISPFMGSPVPSRVYCEHWLVSRGSNPSG